MYIYMYIFELNLLYMHRPHTQLSLSSQIKNIFLPSSLTFSSNSKYSFHLNIKFNPNSNI